MHTWILGKTRLRKKAGHEFEGVVIAYFGTRKGEKRIVVESDVKGADGLLFIFRPDQMEEIVDTAD